jgi:hypothetical protein
MSKIQTVSDYWWYSFRDKDGDVVEIAAQKDEEGTPVLEISSDGSVYIPVTEVTAFCRELLRLSKVAIEEST